MAVQLPGAAPTTMKVPPTPVTSTPIPTPVKKAKPLPTDVFGKPGQGWGPGSSPALASPPTSPIAPGPTSFLPPKSAAEQAESFKGTVHENFFQKSAVVDAARQTGDPTNLANATQLAYGQGSNLGQDQALSNARQQLGVQDSRPQTGDLPPSNTPDELNTNLADTADRISSVLNDTIRTARSSPSSQALAAQLMGNIEAQMVQIQESVLSQIRAQMGQDDPAISAALGVIREEVVRQKQELLEDLNARGLAQSGILLELESRLRKNELTQVEQLVAGRMSEVQNQLMGAMVSFAQQRMGFLQQGFNTQVQANVADRGFDLQLGQLSLDALGQQANRQLQELMQQKGFNFQGGQAALDRANQGNLLDRELGSRADLQKNELTSRESIAGADRTSREGIVDKELTSRESMLVKELASREGIAGADRTSREGIVDKELTSRENIAGAEIGSRERMNAEQLRVQADLNYANNVFRMSLAQIDNSSRETIAKWDNQTRKEIAELSLTDARAAEELASAWKDIATTVLPSITSGQKTKEEWLAMLNSQENAGMPPAVRQAYLTVLNQPLKVAGSGGGGMTIALQVNDPVTGESISQAELNRRKMADPAKYNPPPATRYSASGQELAPSMGVGGEYLSNLLSTNSNSPQPPRPIQASWPSLPNSPQVPSPTAAFGGVLSMLPGYARSVQNSTPPWRR